MQFKLGRNRPDPAKAKMHLRDYRVVGSPLPVPPAVCAAYVGKAVNALKLVYLNDQLGDCVVAGVAHLVGLFIANSGLPPDLFTDAQIIAMYSAIGGYVPGDPSTDGGCDERTALRYWQQSGAPAGSNKILGWVSIDGSNPTKVKTALWLFENLVFGVELPDAWIDPFPSAPGFIWDVAGPANPNNGHCIVGVDYDQRGVQVDSWGMIGTITYEAIAKYATTTGSGELYAVLSPQIIARAASKAPNGYAWDELEADFKEF